MYFHIKFDRIKLVILLVCYFVFTKSRKNILDNLIYIVTTNLITTNYNIT